jgi:hypothetical protein
VPYNCKLKLQENKDWKGKFNQFSDLSKHKDIIDSFNEYYSKCSHLQKEINDDLIAELEKIFDMHINIYTYIDKSQKNIERFKMSELSIAKSNDIARLLYVPLFSLRKVKENYNVDEFHLNSKTPKQFLEDFNSNFFLNRGHFCVLPFNSSLISQKESSNNPKFSICSFCDTVLNQES